MMRVILLTLVLPINAFLPASCHSRPHNLKLLSVESTTTDENILKPSYEIEPLAIRIGHGFDIHRMAPIQDAGQPVVIGGVEIPHKDQKVE